MSQAEDLSEKLQHPLRLELHHELHARPSLYFEGDSDVWHVAFLSEGNGTDLSAALAEAIPDATDRRNGIAALGDGRLKWEAHTEFLTLTFAAPASAGRGDGPPAPFRDLVSRIDGRIIAAIRVLVRDEGEGAVLARPGADYVASQVGGGDAEVHSNFRLEDNGFVEVLLFNRGLNAYRAGRMVRRLLEIETYRMMALLALPVAKETVGRLAAFDARLTQLIEHMQSAVKVDKELLSEVTHLSSDVLNLSAVARHRFGATKAYADLVASRLVEIREDRVEQRQRIGTFIDRRFQPAVRSCGAAERRLDELAERVKLAGDLLRTTVQVQLEDQNASLLASMAERARVQVHIQQAVEGFSVIAITYYTVSLIKVCLESFAEVGLDHSIAKMALLAVVPIIGFAVWRTIRHIRKVIFAQSEPAA